MLTTLVSDCCSFSNVPHTSSWDNFLSSGLLDPVLAELEVGKTLGQWAAGTWFGNPAEGLARDVRRSWTAAEDLHNETPRQR